MELPRIVIKSGGPWQLESGSYSVRQVDTTEALQESLADGWHLDQYAAQDASRAPAAPSEPTRAELEEKARALGVKFDGRTGDKKLAALIEAAP